MSFVYRQTLNLRSVRVYRTLQRVKDGQDHKEGTLFTRSRDMRTILVFTCIKEYSDVDHD